MNAAAAGIDQREEQSIAPAIDILVDRFFAALIPALTGDELAGLERSPLRDGCLAPLIVWKGHRILLDGHNRLALCRKHNIPFAVKELPFASREAAEAFIAMNWDTIKGNWKQITGKVKQKWGQLTDDLTTIAGKREELAGVLQKKYGYGKEQAEREVDDFTNSLDKP